MKAQHMGAFEAKTHFSEILQRVQQGQSFVVTRHGKPVAEIKPLETQANHPQFGSAKGEIRFAPDFDAPLDDMKEYMGVNLLVDTHAFLWFVAGDPRLSTKARRIMESMDSKCHISMASLWEIAIKISLEKLELDASFEDFMQARFQEGFRLLPIAYEHTIGVWRLPFHHRDPFDRLIISQAIHEDMPVVSADGYFKKYGIEVTW